MVVYVLDNYYLAITFLITLGWQVIGFIIAYGLQIDTITDFWSAVNFFALSIITLTFGNQYYGRNIAASVLVMVWAVRLGAWQLFRMIKSRLLCMSKVQRLVRLTRNNSQWEETHASTRCAASPSALPE